MFVSQSPRYTHVTEMYSSASPGRGYRELRPLARIVLQTAATPSLPGLRNQSSHGHLLVTDSQIFLIAQAQSTPVSTGRRRTVVRIIVPRASLANLGYGGGMELDGEN